MATLRIHSSPRAQDLLSQAVQRLRADTDGHPLQPRWVVQPGRLWEQALRRGLATHHMAAGLQFGSLRLTLERACQAWHPQTTLMTEDRLFWHLLHVLAGDVSTWDDMGLPVDSPPRQWWQGRGDDDALNRLQLARLLRTILDDHTTHRPAHVLRWLQGDTPTYGDATWIAALARAVWSDPHTPRPLSLHLPGLIEALLAQPDPPPDRPARVVAVLTGPQPAAYLHALGALARLTDVHLLVLATCERGLSDQLTTWRDVRAAWRRSGATVPFDRFVATENWLLPGSLQAYWGRAGITLQQQLVDLEEALAAYDITVEETADHQPRRPHPTALQTLQDDGYHTQSTRPPAERVTASRRDTLRLINAPAPLRELEGARDAIRHALETDPTLTPADILLVVTDVDRYAPLLPAVFGPHTRKPTDRAPDELPFIPWHLADRSLRSDNDVIAALLQLVDLFNNRLTLPRIADLLVQPAIQARIGLSQQDAWDLVEGLHAAGFRWGLDHRDRQAADQPGQADGMWTLDFALRRLIAGFAWPDDMLDPVGTDPGVTPLARFEGLQAAAWASFGAWWQDVAAARTAFLMSKPLVSPTPTTATWIDWLNTWATRLVAMTGDRTGGAVWWQRIAGRLSDAAGLTGDAAGITLSPAAFSWLLSDAVTEFEQTLPLGLGRGGVTVASPRMARALPARMLIVVGLSDGAWPRPDTVRPRGLLAAAAPGDRVRRDDDKLTALEWICAAQDRLVLTWTGRDPHRGTAVPPSVVVGELQEVCGTTFAEPDFMERLKWHSFDPTHFEPDRPYRSHDQVALQAARRLQSPAPVAADGHHWRCGSVSTEYWPLPGLWKWIRSGQRPDHWTCADWQRLATDLTRFWQLPCRHFLLQVNLALKDTYALWPDRESLAWDGLEKWTIRDQVCTALLTGTDPEAELKRLKHRLARAGDFLPGQAGELAFDQTATEIRDLIQQAREREHEQSARLTRLADMDGRDQPQPLVGLHPGRIGAKQKLQAVIWQAAQTAAYQQPIPVWLQGIGRKKPTTLAAPSPATALAQLRNWTGLALLGTAFPLPFFPESSERYVQDPDGTAFRECFEEGNPFGGGTPESQQPAVRLAFRHLEPLELNLPSDYDTQPEAAELVSLIGLTTDTPLFTQLAKTFFPVDDEG